MSTVEAVADAVLKSLQTVSSEAIPGLIDALLLSSGIHSTSLLQSLVHSFPDWFKDNRKDREESKSDADIEESNLAFVCSVTHLLKNQATDMGILKTVIWTVFIPVARHLGGIFQNKIAAAVSEIAIARHAWGIIQLALFPACLESIMKSIDLESNSQSSSSMFQQPSISVFQISSFGEGANTNLKLAEDSFSLFLACQLVSRLLLAALNILDSRIQHVADDNICNMTDSEVQFCTLTVTHFLEPALKILSQASDCNARKCTLTMLLPPLLKAVDMLDSCHTSSADHISICREFVMQKLWCCCKTLFSQESVQRQDAYTALSLFADYMLPSVSSDASNVDDILPALFDVRSEKEFWEELRKGLVDSDHLTRKKALQVLKISLEKRPTHMKDVLSSNHKDLDMNVMTQSNKDTGIPHKTKRERWAAMEARSLGVGANNVHEKGANRWQRWEAFLLLYEMLEEYGTHLVEAAWSNQISLLLTYGDDSDSVLWYSVAWNYMSEIEKTDVAFFWTSVLWERGFFHGNPQVRCLIFQSFLETDWANFKSLNIILPTKFVLSSFLKALIDPIHHKDFGVGGIFSSKTSKDAARFIAHYSSHLSLSARRNFVAGMASFVKHESTGRAGLISIALCVKSASCGDQWRDVPEQWKSSILLSKKMQECDTFKEHEILTLVDAFRFLVECSKHHFNPKYRSQVCEYCIGAALALVEVWDVPFDRLLSFLSAFPKDFIVNGGILHSTIIYWFEMQDILCTVEAPFCHKEWMSNNLYDYAMSFMKPHSCHDLASFDDEQVHSWIADAEKWARVLCLGVLKEDQVRQILNDIKKSAFPIVKYEDNLTCVPERFLVLLLVLLDECQSQRALGTIVERNEGKEEAKQAFRKSDENFAMVNNISDMIVDIMENIVLYARSSMKIFFSPSSWNEPLPAALRGKLGGASQRRLPCSVTPCVLRAILSLKAVAECAMWWMRLTCSETLHSVCALLFEFSWKAVEMPVPDNEVEAEIQLAAYEALVSVSKAISTIFSLLAYKFSDINLVYGSMEVEHMVNNLVMKFLESVNMLLQTGKLARSRYAKLLQAKWSCLESFLSISRAANSTGNKSDEKSAISNSVLKSIVYDAAESLQCCDEESLVEIMKCVRWIMRWGLLSQLSSSTNFQTQEKIQVMWLFVQSTWMACCDSNKRRVAPIAIILSAIFHPSIFGDTCMHSDGNGGQGPLKWFVGNLLEQGSRSPRTMRLTALHLTGMWLLHPKVINFYMKELKILTLHGSVAIDEDLDVELMESHVYSKEYQSLLQSNDVELTEAFLNTEMYARISVAVLFDKLAELVENTCLEKHCIDDISAALNAGKSFLLELLEASVSDADLTKELYKKFSAVHRRKTRAWQMLCILSRFVDAGLVDHVLSATHTSLNRNNLPAVRQYIEIFAMNIYLKFPRLVVSQLVPILSEHNLKSQVLASYVFISVHVLLNVSPSSLQFHLLDKLLPAVFPLLTSHHHSLRCFSQILVYRVLKKFANVQDSNAPIKLHDDAFGKNCLLSVMRYLDGNTDCVRLRTSIERYIDAFDPVHSTRARGIFSVRNREAEHIAGFPFECAPVSIIEHVIEFLNEVRGHLRSSMAEEAAVLRREQLLNKASVKGEYSSLVIQKDSKTTIASLNGSSRGTNDFSGESDRCLDFQRKILSPSLADMEYEDELLISSLERRLKEAELLGGRQHNLIVVASLLGRIPNLAGLARTCEVFKAEALVISDIHILQDKQFQLISVTAEKWVAILEVPETNLKEYLNSKRMEGYSLLGLEQTTNSTPLDQYTFPKKTVLVLGKEKEGIPVDIIHVLDACVEIPQYGVIRSLNVHVSGAIAVWEYVRQHHK